MAANQSWTTCLYLTTLLSTSALGQEALPIRLSIVLYDEAHVSPKTLRRAEGIAAAILVTAAVQATWEIGETQELRNLRTDFTAYSARECQAMASPALLRVQILPKAPAGLIASALGFSLPCARSGLQVTVYSDRIANVSQRGGLTFGRVLGYALAHEFGHVLLHSDAHEPAGLMKAIWSKSDWQQTAVGTLLFSPDDVHQIAVLHEPATDTSVRQLASLTKR